MAIPSIINSFKTATYYKKEARKINPIQAYYNESPFAKNQYGLANQMLNSRMAGANELEKNIQSAQGNNLHNINANATDASQALAMAAASQGQAQQGFQNLGIMEQQNKQSAVGNYNAGAQAMVSEGDKKHSDDVRRYTSDQQRKDAMQAAYFSHKTEGIKQIEALVRTFISMMAGGIGGGAMGGASGGGGGANMGGMMSLFGNMGGGGK